MRKIILILSLAIGLVSCDLQEIHQETTPMPLRQIANMSKTEKSADGTLILFFATYHSEEKDIDVVKVFAEVDGLYRFIEMPISKIKIRIDNSISTPYIQARYTRMGKSPIWFSNTEVMDGINIRFTLDDYVITCPEQYLPERLLPIDITNK